MNSWDNKKLKISDLNIKKWWYVFIKKNEFYSFINKILFILFNNKFGSF